MARLINVSSRNAPSVGDPYAEAQRDQNYADLVLARAIQPHDFGIASSGQANVQGLTQLAQALLGRSLEGSAGKSLDAANAQMTDQNKALVDALAPNIIKGGTVPGQIPLDSLGPNDHVTSMTTPVAVADRMNPARPAIDSAIGSMDPRAAHEALSGALLRNAFPDPAIEESRKMREAMFTAAERDKAAAVAERAREADQASLDRRYSVDEGAKLRTQLAAEAAATRAAAAKDKTDAKAQAGLDKLDMAAQSINDNMDLGIAAVERLHDHPGLDRITGAIYGRTWDVTDNARNAAAQLHNIESEVMINSMQALKAASSTGATGMGQLSEKEGEVLRNSIRSLDRTQSTPEFKRSLEDIAARFKQIKQRAQENIDRAKSRLDPTSVAPAPAGMSAPVTAPASVRVKVDAQGNVIP